METGGDTTFEEEGKPQRQKTTIRWDLDYLEKTLDASDEAEGTLRSVRDYQNVSIDVAVGDRQFHPTLKPEHRRIVVEAVGQNETLFSPDGNLTRDELDAVDIQGSSLLLDRLLPRKAVAVGDQWPCSNELMAAFLGLDEVAKNNVECSLKEVADTVARFEMVGRVEGAVGGVSTVIDVKGRFRYDLRVKRVDWLGMLIKEVHGSSFVADGLDAVSRLSVKVTPGEPSESLTEEALGKVAEQLRASPESEYLVFESANGDWQFGHDRRWFLHHRAPKSDAAVLRMIDRGEFLGQCNLSSLAQREPDKLPSLEAFQEDVKKALGESFGEFVEAGQSSNDANYRVYRVAVDGTSAEIPMRWIYYLIADSQGRQVAFTFAVEQSHVERFGQADRSIVESTRFR